MHVCTMCVCMGGGVRGCMHTRMGVCGMCGGGVGGCTNATHTHACMHVCVACVLVNYSSAAKNTKVKSPLLTAHLHW